MNRLITTFTIALSLAACGDTTEPLTYGEALEVVVDAFCEKAIECGFDTDQADCVAQNVDNLCLSHDCSEDLSELQMDLLPYCIEEIEGASCDPFLTPAVCYTVLDL